MRRRAYLLLAAGCIGSAFAQTAQPPIRKPPPEDTARYVAWMAKSGTPVVDSVGENVALRIGDWGFFSQGPAHQAPRDVAALDRTGHVVTPSEKGDWHTFLSTPGLDAAGALARVAYLFRAAPLDPASAPKVADRDKITAPVLTASKDVATFQGWLLFPPNMNAPMRVTITARPGEPKLAFNRP